MNELLFCIAVLAAGVILIIFNRRIVVRYAAVAFAVFMGGVSVMGVIASHRLAMERMPQLEGAVQKAWVDGAMSAAREATQTLPLIGCVVIAPTILALIPSERD